LENCGTALLRPAAGPETRFGTVSH
jgi:hypothetical protein